MSKRLEIAARKTPFDLDKIFVVGHCDRAEMSDLAIFIPSRSKINEVKNYNMEMLTFSIWLSIATAVENEFHFHSHLVEFDANL